MKYITLAITILFFSTIGFSQSSKKKKDSNYYIEINDSTVSNSKPDRGAILTGYYKSDTLEKITTWFGFSYGDVTRTYYYWKNDLIMITELQKLYNTNPQTPVDPATVKPNYEGRYIFTDGVLKDMKQTGTYSFNDSPSDKPSMERMFTDFSNKYVKELDEKRAKKKNRIKITAS